MTPARQSGDFGCRAVVAGALAACTLLAAFTERAAAQAAAPTVFVLNRFVSGAGTSPPGVVTSLRQLADGSLSFVDDVEVGHEPNSIALSPDGTLLAVGGGFTGTISDELVLFQVNANSTLTHLFSRPDGVPTSAFEMIWLSNDLLAVTETDTIGDNYVHVYRWLPSLSRMVRTDVKTTGGFTTSLAFDGSHNFLYTESSLGDNTIKRFSVNPATGRLTLIETVLNFDAALDLTITKDQRFLYAGSGAAPFGGCNVCINGYDITDTEQMIPLFNPMTSPVVSPARLAASESGHLFVAHGGSGIVVSFEIGPAGDLLDTGFGTTVDGISGIASMGPWLFIVDNTTLDDGVRGVRVYRIGMDGSLSELAASPFDQGAVPVSFEAIELWPGTGAPLCLCEADGDDAQVDVFDLLAYLDLWFVSDSGADVDGTPGVDVFDLLAFLDCWFPASAGAPCP